MNPNAYLTIKIRRSLKKVDIEKSDTNKRCCKKEYNFNWNPMKVADRKVRLIPRKRSCIF